MKNINQNLILGGINLLALGVSASDATVLQAYTPLSSNSHQNQSMTNEQMRNLEASHLEVFAACKWGHAAFDPVMVKSETLSEEVLSLYSQMG